MFPIKTGPRGGRFYVNEQGRKIYTSKTKAASTTHGVKTRVGGKVIIGSKTEEGKIHVPAWSAKRNRQYEHIQESELARGTPEPLARRIAAATVNKTRALHGELKKKATPKRRTSTRKKKAK